MDGSRFRKLSQTRSAEFGVLDALLEFNDTSKTPNLVSRRRGVRSSSTLKEFMDHFGDDTTYSAAKPKSDMAGPRVGTKDHWTNEDRGGLINKGRHHIAVEVAP